VVDLIFCDVNMPDETGLELLASLKHSGIAVVMLTGDDDPATAESALASGAYTYLVKPVGPNEVLINVGSALRRRELELTQRGYLQELENKVVLRTSALRDALENLQQTESNARLADHDTVDRLITALTLRSEETGSHIRRVGLYAALLARAVRNPWSQDEIRHAAMLHDVGKIGIPDAILLKPGPLTSDEFEIIKRHCGLGASLLNDTSSRLLTLAAEIALTHHERWDGSGYPNRLAAESIPLSGRIVAVADVFDALCSDRVYRKAMPVTDAIALMREDRGRHFDPDLFDRFTSAPDALTLIGASHPDAPEVAPAIPQPALPGAAPTRAEVGAGPSAMTLQEAAEMLSVSSTTLRRWADAGRIEVERTRGGHRRFPVDEVKRIKAQQPSAGSVEVRKVAPPSEPLAPLAKLLDQRGREIHELVARSLYLDRGEGWFASPEASERVAEWTQALAVAARSGDYAPAFTATAGLARIAERAGTSMLERYTQMEFFSERVVRELAGPETATRSELIGSRRFFAGLRQILLEQ
jgi:putative two-component system response regulator